MLHGALTWKSRRSGLGWGDLRSCPGGGCGGEEEAAVLGVGRRSRGGGVRGWVGKVP